MKINNFLELKDFQKLSLRMKKIELDESLLSRVDKSFQF